MIYQSAQKGDEAGARVAEFDGRQVALTPYQAQLLGITAKTYPEVPAGVQVAAVQSPDPQAVLDAGNERAQKNVERKKSWWQKATGNIGKSLDFITPEPVEDVLGAAGSVVKPVTRGGFAVLETPLQFGVGIGRNTYGAVTGSYKPQGVRDFFTDVAEQTTVGQVIRDWQADRPVELGTGFFPEAAKFDEQGNPTNTVGRRTAFERSVATIGNSAWTPGRWVATDIFKLQPGSGAANIVSGIGDAAVAIYADPTNIVLDKVAEANRARKIGTSLVSAASVERAAKSAAPEWRKTVEEGLGLIPGTYKSPRESVLTSQTGRWLYSEEGRQVITSFAGETSASEIWRQTGKKFPIDLANQLAKTDDPAAIVNILADRLTSDVRFLPTSGMGIADRVVRSRQEQGRLWNILPDTRIDWADPESAIRNVDNALANANIHGDERKALLDQWAEALTGTKDKKQARFNAMKLWGDTLRTQLKAEGVPDALADQLTQFTRRMNDAPIYGVDEFAKGIEFAPGEGPGPLMISQLLNTGYYLYDPGQIRKIRESTMSPGMLKFIANNPAWRAPVSFIGAIQDEIWKPATLIKPSYLAKLLPEGFLRVNFGGRFESPLDYIATMFDRRGTNVFGDEMVPFAKKADRLAAEEKALEKRLADADPLVRQDAGERLQKIADERNELNNELTRRFDMYTQAMNRGKRNQLWDEAGYEREMAQQVRQGNVQIVNKDQFPELWVRGNAEDLLQMHSDPIARRVANGGLFEGDARPFTRPDDVVAGLGTRLGLEEIVDWVNHGAGKKFRDEFAQRFPDMNPERVGRRMVYVARDNLLYRTGGDFRLLDAVAKGRIGDEAIGFASYVKGSAPSQSLLDALEDVRLNNPDAAPFARIRGQVAVNDASSGRNINRFIALRDQAVGWFFQDVFGKMDDYINRSPAWRSYYFQRVEELAPHMSPAEAKALVSEGTVSLSKAQAKRIRELAGKASGDLTREDVHKMAGAAALDDTQKLMFDGTKRSQLFDVVRVAAPFGEAWREILTSYSRLVRQNPRVIRRFQQGVNAARGSGFFYTDEQGNEQYRIPLSGALLSAFTGGKINADLSGSVEGLSLGTQVIPGLGPTAGFLASEWIPNEPEFDWVRRTLFPFGEPEGIDLLPVPAWLSKLTQGAGWADGATAASTKNQVLNALYATGEYGNSKEEIQRLLADTDKAARGVLFARGLSQLITPSAPIVRFTAETPNGDVLAAKLGDEFRKLEEEEGYDVAVQEFLGKYGTGAALYLVGNTRAQVPGLDASKEFGDFERTHGWLFNEHPEIAGYFGPRGEGFDYATYIRQLEAGQREPLSPNERLAAANQLIGEMVVNEQIAQMPPRAKWTDYERGYIRQLKAEVEQEYPGYTAYPPIDINAQKRQIDDLVEAASDPRISDSPIAGAILQYAAARDQAQRMAESRGRASFDTSKDTADLRGWLSLVGSELTDQTPGFGIVWDRLLSREVESDD